MMEKEESTMFADFCHRLFKDRPRFSTISRRADCRAADF